MSHCSHIYTTDSDDPTDHDACKVMSTVCKARIPFIWIAMYAPGDSRAQDTDYEQDEEDWEEQYLVFMTSPREAVINLERRMESLKKLIPEQYHNHITNLIQKLNQIDKRYVGVAIDDIEQIGSDSMTESAKGWEDILKGLDKPVMEVRTGLSKLLKGSGIPESWKALLASSGMDVGAVATKITEINNENEWIISGGLTAEEILEWET